MSYLCFINRPSVIQFGWLACFSHNQKQTPELFYEKDLKFLIDFAIFTAKQLMLLRIS